MWCGYIFRIYPDDAVDPSDCYGLLRTGTVVSKAGGELIYNTVGINKHIGFFSSWLIMAAWIAVPPSAVMAIVQWMFHVLHIQSSFLLIEGVALVALIGYCALSLQNVEIAGKIQLYMLMFAIAGCIVATVAFLFSGVWSFDNLRTFLFTGGQPFWHSVLDHRNWLF